MTSPGGLVSLPAAGGNTVAGFVSPGPVKEAQIRPHPSQVRGADAGGHCLTAGRLLRNLPRLLAAGLTTWLVLMASGCRLLSSVASTASATTAAVASGRNGGDDRRLLLWLVHGSNQAGLLAMESPQLVRLNHQIPHILVVVFT